MGRWQDRKEAAKARGMWFPKATPKKEYHVYCVNAAEISDREKEVERIKERLEAKEKPEDKKAKAVPKEKEVKKVKAKKVAKKQKPKIEKPKKEVNYGEHGHDFNSEED